MARAVECNICHARQEALVAVTAEEWRLYFLAPHALWDPADPVKIPGFTLQYLHVCPPCGVKVEALFGPHKSEKQGG